MKQRVDDEQEKLEQAIASLEAQRSSLGDAIVDASVAALREKIQAMQTPVESSTSQRKQVTVLFADIANFTSLSETADAEDITEFANKVWEIVDQIILQHGGMIDKHIGDAVMAIWGSENAAEDDAEQAIRAALEMHASLANWELRGAGGKITPLPAVFRTSLPPKPLRIGIHSGPVFLARVGSTREYTAMGDTVNTASRIHHAADPGQTIISHDAYQRVRGLFEVLALPPLRLKGKADPLQAYFVERVKPRVFRPGTRGVDDTQTRMVGREADLKRLQDALTDILDRPQCRVFTVVGEPGIGKSRLLYEFENWGELLPQTIRHFKGRASHEMQKQPYALLRDVFSTRFQIQENDPPGVVREKFEQGIGEISGMNTEGQMRAHVIGQLLGYDFSDSPHLQGTMTPRHLRSRALFYIVDFLRGTTELRPTVLFLEDIHWADDSSLDIIEEMASALVWRRLLIVCLSRPTLLERRPDWGKRIPGHTLLRLTPLSLEHSRELIQQLLQKAAMVPEELYNVVVSEAEGNPYYVEEFIKMLIDDGVIVKHEVEWEVMAALLNQVHIPATLTGIIQARLDSIHPDERRFLQQASVIGRTFWDNAVAYLDGGDVEGAPHGLLEQCLNTLRQREMIFEYRTSVFSGAREFVFKHALLRQVTYESVLKRDRRSYHARAADWLIQHSGERAAEYAGVIGEHLELAGDIPQAIVYLRLAGERAARQFDNEHALTYFDRALALTPEEDIAMRYNILKTCEQIHDLIGMREAQRENLEKMDLLLKQAEALDIELPGGRAGLALRLSNYSCVISDYQRAITAAQDAVEHASRAGDPTQEAEGHYRWGRASWYQGDNEGGLTATRRSLAMAQAVGARQLQAHCFRQIGAIVFHQGDYAQVMPAYAQALEIYQAIDDRAGISSTLNNMGDQLRLVGDYAEARAHFEQSVEISRSIGERWSECIALGNLAQVAINLEDYPAGMVSAQQALEIAYSINLRASEAYSKTIIGRALDGLGKAEEAITCFQEAITLRQEMRQPNLAAETQAGLASIYLSQREYAKALETVEEVLRYLDANTLYGVEEPFQVYLNCFRVLRANQDGRAWPLLDLACRLLREQAERITDAQIRQSFLQNVRAHAELMREWQAAQ